VKVIGILAKTGTEVDNYHLVSFETLEGINGNAVIRTTVAPDGSSKLFYEINGNTPIQIIASLPEDTLNHSVNIAGKIYQPIFIGASEADLMRKEKIFKREGDLINDFFGNDVIVAGILPRTDSPLDNFHYVKPGFTVK
jgi:hypothetical protein